VFRKNSPKVITLKKDVNGFEFTEIVPVGGVMSQREQPVSLQSKQLGHTQGNLPQSVQGLGQLQAG
jgi:hypothetical protein